MSADEDLDPRFGIPPSAWWIGLASIVVAVVVMKAIPGPVAVGCLHSKSCFPAPRPPLIGAVLVLMGGAFLSTLVGRVPRHWVVGWSTTLAGIAAVVMATAPLVEGVFRQPLREGSDAFKLVFTVTVGTGLMFVSFAVVLAAAGLLATALVPEPPSLVVRGMVPADVRPRWQQEIEAVCAALGGRAQGRLRSEESLLVAELAYALESGALQTPVHLETTGPQLLELLSRKDGGLDLRAAVLERLAQALSARDGRSLPYRSL